MRLYRALLRFYPVSFRNEYGGEMSDLFEQRRRDASRPLGLLLLWLETFLELPWSALQVHWDIFSQDIRYTGRTLSRSPGFALMAVLVTALGIGATSASFSVTDHVLLRPLPFEDPDRLVHVWESPPGYSQMEPSPPNYRDWKKASRSFESMGAYARWAANLVGDGEPERVDLAVVTAEVFPILGVEPMLGRVFLDDDTRSGAPGTIVLSHNLWENRFGGDPRVLGKKVLLDGSPYEVIGVMPADFNFPSRDVLLWGPLQLGPGDFEDRNNNYLHVVARLKQGVSLDQARAEMTGIAGRLEREYPVENADNGITVNRIQDEISNQPRMLLLALLGASLCVLLIASTNLSNLLLVRALGRRQELALRLALGAGRERLTRQLLTESLTLALVGGLLGVLVAKAAIPLLARLVPANLPIAQVPDLDLRALVVGILLTLATGLVFGVFPALGLRSEEGATALREGPRSGGGRRRRLRSALVIAEVAISVVLLVSVGLLSRALFRIQDVDPGFQADGVLTLRTALPIPKYAKTSARQDFYSRVLSQVRALPGVSDAAYISFLPMVMRGGIWPVSIDGRPHNREGSETASLRYVTPEFFSTLGIPIERGRDVAEGDTQEAPFVALVSKSFARRYWPGLDPIGRRFKFAFSDRTVVGVVGDVRVRGLDRESEPQVYIPAGQVEDGSIIGYIPKDLAIRANNPENLVPAVRRIIHQVDQEQPVSDVRLLTDIVAAETLPRKAQLRVIAAFAIAAFLLAGIGIHGLLAYAVSQRQGEIGMRMALGARARHIVRLVLRESLLLAAIGAVGGTLLAYVAGRAMEALLFGVRPGDPVTYAAVLGLSLAMTLAGSLLPVVRAVRVDPTTVVRAQ